MRKINNKFNGDCSLFDVFFDRDNLSWVNWERTVPQFDIPVDGGYKQMIVPTMDSIRIKGVFNKLLKASYPVLVVGPTGTGKSVMID